MRKCFHNYILLVFGFKGKSTGKDANGGFKPGNYTVKAKLETGSVTYEFTQNFSWGVLAINVDKSIYLPGDDAYIQMGVLNDTGNTICSADSLTLQITSPSGQKYPFSLSDGTIAKSGECNGNNFVDKPDY